MARKQAPKKQTKGKTSIKKQLGEETKKVNEYLDHLQRLQAEFDNYRKKAEQERQGIMKQANHGLIQKFLGILDSFESAFKNRKEDDEFAKGMKLVFLEIYLTLEKEGLKKIDCLGKKFDPKLHEVMLQEESKEEEGTIIEELQKGYMLNDRVIRFSKVKTSKGGKDEKNIDS
ncbi:MAG: nucleotide exchange factor GrpE [Nanoarchaeota archaeon]|nr:nucleotide exchange factor GrpE [Nanoarchaeota archaeon]